MRIVFSRGFGPYLPGVPIELPDPLAEVHVRCGRATPAADEDAAAEPSADAPPAKKPTARKKK